ncbi:hypothetical protein KSF_094930 [Reticulibacter mediterranei]|uniref:MFS transporter n=1 Tax=Reticulibacter mediterranei TaxID=2778369 RepID=A0A8J3N8E3_9CHLR|nr:hypothetical protein [Reticulibacter mediterranei]GHO99445.1 hypothetical protein KSF_094930 [Reticulibacter mediterranei]
MRSSTSANTAPSHASKSGERLRGWSLITVMVGLALSLFLAALDQTIVATALPTIAGELHGLRSS